MPRLIQPATFSRLQALLDLQSGWRVTTHLAGGARLGIPPVICAHRPARKEDAPRVVVSAGVHGDEPAGVFALMDLLQSGSFSEELEWILFPAFNPSGLLCGTRETSEGVDLNRDFKLCRAAETRFYLEQMAPFDRVDLHLSLHEDWEYEAAYLYELNSAGRHSIAEALLDEVDGGIGLLDAEVIDGHRATARGFIRHEIVPDEPEGWPEAIYLARKYSLLSYTLETPSGAPLAHRVHCARTFVERAVEVMVASEEGM